MSIDPFRPSAAAMQAHKKLMGDLPATSNRLFGVDQDTSAIDPADLQPFEYIVQALRGPRVYRPKGRTLAIIKHLHEVGPLTTEDLARAIGCKVTDVWASLTSARSWKIVQHSKDRPAVWSIVSKDAK